MHRALLGLLAAACSSPGAVDADVNPTCASFVGDPAQPVELEIIALDAAGQSAAVAEGGRVPLILPPQGGKVVFVGVRARNVCAGPIQLLASVRDQCATPMRIVGLEGRPVVYVAGSDGWAEPGELGQISSYANVPLCPNVVSSRDIQDQPYQLTIQVKDHLGRAGQQTTTITPFCGEPANEADCQCTCALDYDVRNGCRAQPDAGSGTQGCPSH
jgi:hypothetical protein